MMFTQCRRNGKHAKDGKWFCRQHFVALGAQSYCALLVGDPKTKKQRHCKNPAMGAGPLHQYCKLHARKLATPAELEDVNQVVPRSVKVVPAAAHEDFRQKFPHLGQDVYSAVDALSEGAVARILKGPTKTGAPLLRSVYIFAPRLAIGICFMLALMSTCREEALEFRLGLRVPPSRTPSRRQRRYETRLQDWFHHQGSNRAGCSELASSPD
jgi:hypothetical protein